jgi:hypothetical protein
MWIVMKTTSDASISVLTRTEAWYHESYAEARAFAESLLPTTKWMENVSMHEAKPITGQATERGEP